MATIRKTKTPAKSMPRKASVSRVPKAAVASKMDRLDSVLIDLSLTKNSLKDLEAQATSLQQEAMKLMGELKIDSRQVVHAKHKIRATIVRSTTLIINESQLAKRLGAAMWNKVTTRKLDRNKLDAFVASNEVDANIVAACSTETDRAPYLRLSGQ